MDDTLTVAALVHPDPQVHRFGFDLQDPYVEQCWGSLIGPSGVAILRRAPVLWERHEPAEVPAGELACSLGLGEGTAPSARFTRALNRLERFGLATWLEPGTTIGIYAEVTPLADRQLARVPEWTRRTHSRLLSDHLDRLATLGHTPVDNAIAPSLDRPLQLTRTPLRAPLGLSR